MSSRKAEGFQVGIIQWEKWVFRTWAAEGEVFRTCLGYGHSGVWTQITPGWFLDVLRDISWALSLLCDFPCAGSAGGRGGPFLPPSGLSELGMAQWHLESPGWGRLEVGTCSTPSSRAWIRVTFTLA